jgi:hypothetical protein
MGNLATPNYISNSEASGIGTFRSSGAMTIWGGTSTTIKSTSNNTSLADTTITLGGKTAKSVLHLDASSALVATALTNGQLLIGSTNNVPVAATITAGSNLAVTNSTGSITIGTNSSLRSYLATTVTYNNTATLASTALSTTVEASGIYDIELTVHSDSSVNSLALDFGGTATFTNFIGEWQSRRQDEISSVDQLGGQRVTAAGTDYVHASMDGAASYYTFKGTAEINVAGTFILRGAQRGANASDTTILRGSTLILRKLN